MFPKENSCKLSAGQSNWLNQCNGHPRGPLLLMGILLHVQFGDNDNDVDDDIYDDNDDDDDDNDDNDDDDDDDNDDSCL